MITKENCEFFTTWNENQTILSHQTDWNNTLLTVINKLSNQIHKSTYDGGANTIIVNPSKNYLFESMSSYDQMTNRLAGRYNVIYDDNCEHNVIYVYSNKIDNNRKVYYTRENDGGNFMTLKMTFNEELIRQIKKKYCSYILIPLTIKFGK